MGSREVKSSKVKAPTKFTPTCSQNDSSINQKKKFFLKNWMTILSPEISNKRLIDIQIPASHNSNTDKILHHGFRVTEISKCQDLSIYGQLCSGIRFLDIRYGNNDFASLKCPVKISNFSNYNYLGNRLLRIFKASQKERKNL